MTLPWQVPGSATASFEVRYNPVAGMADVAVASLVPIAAAEFRHGAIPQARWTARPYETEIEFRRRITADLKSDGTLSGAPPGAHVLIYERGDFWSRNMAGARLPPPR